MNRRDQRIAAWRRRRRAANKGPGITGCLLRSGGSCLVISLLTVGLLVVLGVGSVAGVYAYFAKDLPDAGAIETEQVSFETVRIWDRTGQHLLYEAIDPRPYRGDRTYVPLDQISRYLRDATVALEDRSFYENMGFNPRGLLRAQLQNMQGGQIQGGSSITQQLVKNVLIEREERSQRLYSRKIKEVILAVEITRRYPKDQILEWYVNSNFYGNFAVGIEAAARIYFDKPSSDLSLAEAAMLAALPQYPGLNPIDNPEPAKDRQRVALQAMADAGYISQEEAHAAFLEPLQVREQALERFDNLSAPHFALFVLDWLKDTYNTSDDPYFIWREGLQVYTTLDLDLQTQTECIVRSHVAHLRHEEPPDDPACLPRDPIPQLESRQNVDHNISNGAAVAIRPRTGEVLALVGSLDYNNTDIDGQVNVALSERQPGSSFKPFTYLTAFSKGYSPATMVLDVPMGFPDPETGIYAPENYDRRVHGAMQLRQALQNSYNIPAVWLMDQVGVKTVVETAHHMGIDTLTKDYYGLSLTLGGGEVQLIDMAYAFSVFANMGTMAGQPVPPERQRPGYRNLDPVSVLQIVDRNGDVVYRYETPEVQEVLTPNLAYLMLNVLTDTDERGSFGSFAEYLTLPGRTVGAKTGTTNDWRDAWTIGFTPQLAVGVWVGNSDNEPMNRVAGSIGAAPIFHDVMAYAHRDLPVERWTEPPGLQWEDVCYPSGLLPTEDCPRTVREIFLYGNAPTTHDTVYQPFEINRENGRLATSFTPPELKERRVYAIYPPIADDWVREAGIEQPPRQWDDSHGPSSFDPETAIIEPGAYSFVRGVVPVIGNARAGDFQNYRLEFGPGLNPPSWSHLGGDHGNQVGEGGLELWDVSALDGLYTLQLTVNRGGGPRTASVQVTIDNISPTVTLLHPEDGAVYVMEDDEWVRVSAEASDSWAMDRVEYYLDGELLGSTTVAPYSYKWTIAMSDTIPVPGTIISETRVITNPDGIAELGEVRVSEVITGTDGRLTWWFENGRTIISDTLGYTETHIIQVKAYDAAGNVSESEELRIFVMHEEKDEEQAVAMLPSLIRWSEIDREQRVATARAGV
ncbi:MAG TPA: transglycosylase domain-containing protein [Anaerolineae bacterium]|nr:transglycosylase domain-containing protein [Anaerolineae bacterium]